MIKNWKLMSLAFLFVMLLGGLGYWQVIRANEKKSLLNTYATRTKALPLHVRSLKQAQDLRFYRAELTGHFDNHHSILLDNKTFKGQPGYEVYTPFHADGLDKVILVDRGFVPLGKDRKTLPAIDSVIGKITITGLLNTPPIFYTMAKQMSENASWPLRVEYMDIPKLSERLQFALYPYILTLTPDHPGSYQIEWKIVMMGPERHMGYAVQWFALALTLLIISLILNKRSTRRPKDPTQLQL